MDATSIYIDVSEELICECKMGNSHNLYAVAMKITIGGEANLLICTQKLSDYSSLSIRRVGQYNSMQSQGGS